ALPFLSTFQRLCRVQDMSAGAGENEACPSGPFALALGTMLAAIRLPLPPMGSASPMLRRSASAVPSNATVLVQEVHANGAHKAAFYLAGGRIVAYRQWRDTGQVELEYALRDGVKHGKEYHFYADGRLRAEESYYRGKRHGVGRQWSA